jgi:hypothetical protein
MAKSRVEGKGFSEEGSETMRKEIIFNVKFSCNNSSLLM